MPGFTAINAHTPVASTLNSETKVKPVPKERKATRRRHPARKQPAAQDAGEEAFATTSKRISGKGKKRSSHAEDEQEPKRRKSNGIKASMPASKSTVSSTTTVNPEDSPKVQAPSHSSTDDGLVSPTPKPKFHSFRYCREQAAVNSKIEPLSNQSIPVSYTSETSMTSSLPQTTMQAVRNSSKGGSLLYSSSANLPSTAQAADHTRPAIGTTSTLAFNSPIDASVEHARPVIGSTPTLASSTPNTRDADVPQQHRNVVPSHASAKKIAHDAHQSGRHALRSKSDDFGDPIDENDDELIELARLAEDKQSSTRGGKPHALRSTSNDFGPPIEEDDDEVFELMRRAENYAHKENPSKSPPSRARKLNIRETHAHDDYGGALLSEEERKLLDAIKVPQDTRKPVVRIEFPAPILDRSPLFGVSNASALRTCFRVGEALNAGCQAVRNNRSLVLELYARITSSWREPKPSRKQHFVIHDLYHDRAPVMNGTFELWDQSALWEQDSKPFLEAGADGMICRMIAKMKRDGTKWRLEILSIWQADWEDVEHVASIYARPMVEDNS